MVTNDDATRTSYRTCPLCEATCGLELRVESGRVTHIRGDRDNVFSRGFICPKGSTLRQLHDDPDRVRTPLIRSGDGFVDATWDEAFELIGQRLLPIIAEHGPDAVGMYLGNPNAHNMSGLFWMRPLIRALGSRNLFSASTVDQMPRHVSSGLMFGDPFAFVVPDLDRTDFLLVLGANPYVSNGSLATAPDWPGRLDAIRERGGRIVVVDPRRTETAQRADEHVPVRPGSDALLLCALINVIDRDGLVDLGDAEPHVRGLDAALGVVAEMTPERASVSTGIDAGTIRRLAHELAEADRAAVYGRVGVHTVIGGTVASWATDVLNTITGNLDRPGGAMWGLGPHARPDPVGGIGRGYRTGRWTSRVSGRPEANGELPVGILAEEIETGGPGQIRGLITIAGNPVLSTPDGNRLEAALAGLDFMVSIDIYVNETTRHADVILPAPSAFEKPHFDAGYLSFALRRHAVYSPATLPSTGPSESNVLARLALMLRGEGSDADPSSVHEELLVNLLTSAATDRGSNVHGRDPAALRALVDGDTPEAQVVDVLVRTGPWGDGFGARPDGLSLQRLLDHPHGIDLGPLEPRLPDNLRTTSGMIELAPPEIVDTVADLFTSIEAQPAGGLRLIGRRHLRSNNSWMHNVPVLMRGAQRCTVMIHPRDAADRGLESGDSAVIASEVGEIELEVAVTDEVMPGVISVPHGWGHGRPGARMTVASARPGVNVNVLVGGSPLDQPSGNAVLNGIPVRMRRSFASGSPT